MNNSKTKILALVASAALAAMLGLAACGGTSASSAASSTASGSASAASASASSAAASDSASAASESASASSAAASASASAADSVSLSALAEELFQNCLVGTDDKNVLYFYAQGEDNKTAALLVYDMTNDAFSAHSGTYEEPTVGTVRIDTKGAGEAIEFKVVPNADKTAVAFTFDNGTTVNMGPVVDEDTKKMLNELDQLMAQVNASAETPSA
jgi:hypothetical protein